MIRKQSVRGITQDEINSHKYNAKVNILLLRYQTAIKMVIEYVNRNIIACRR
jgi:hypothetical protein